MDSAEKTAQALEALLTFLQQAPNKERRQQQAFFKAVRAVDQGNCDDATADFLVCVFEQNIHALYYLQSYIPNTLPKSTVKAIQKMVTNFQDQTVTQLGEKLEEVLLLAQAYIKCIPDTASASCWYDASVLIKEYKDIDKRLSDEKNRKPKKGQSQQTVLAHQTRLADLEKKHKDCLGKLMALPPNALNARTFLKEQGLQMNSVLNDLDGTADRLLGQNLEQTRIVTDPVKQKFWQAAAAFADAEAALLFPDKKTTQERAHAFLALGLEYENQYSGEMKEFPFEVVEGLYRKAGELGSHEGWLAMASLQDKKPNVSGEVAKKESFFEKSYAINSEATVAGLLQSAWFDEKYLSGKEVMQRPFSEQDLLFRRAVLLGCGLLNVPGDVQAVQQLIESFALDKKSAVYAAIGQFYSAHLEKQKSPSESDIKKTVFLLKSAVKYNNNEVSRKNLGDFCFKYFQEGESVILGDLKRAERKYEEALGFFDVSENSEASRVGYASTVILAAFDEGKIEESKLLRALNKVSLTNSFEGKILKGLIQIATRYDSEDFISLQAQVVNEWRMLLQDRKKSNPKLMLLSLEHDPISRLEYIISCFSKENRPSLHDALLLAHPSIQDQHSFDQQAEVYAGNNQKEISIVRRVNSVVQFSPVPEDCFLNSPRTESSLASSRSSGRTSRRNSRLSSAAPSPLDLTFVQGCIVPSGPDGGALSPRTPGYTPVAINFSSAGRKSVTKSPYDFKGQRDQNKTDENRRAVFVPLRKKKNDHLIKCLSYMAIDPGSINAAYQNMHQLIDKDKIKDAWESEDPAKIPSVIGENRASGKGQELYTAVKMLDRVIVEHKTTHHKIHDVKNAGDPNRGFDLQVYVGGFIKMLINEKVITKEQLRVAYETLNFDATEQRRIKKVFEAAGLPEMTAPIPLVAP